MARGRWSRQMQIARDHKALSPPGGAPPRVLGGKQIGQLCELFLLSRMHIDRDDHLPAAMSTLRIQGRQAAAKRLCRPDVVQGGGAYQRGSSGSSGCVARLFGASWSGV